MNSSLFFVLDKADAALELITSNFSVKIFLLLNYNLKGKFFRVKINCLLSNVSNVIHALQGIILSKLNKTPPDSDSLFITLFYYNNLKILH